MLYDMHIHSRVSHDGRESGCDIAKACVEKNISAFAITDHCDIQLCDEMDVFAKVQGSLEEAKIAREAYKDKVKVLLGIEIGEAIWNLDYAKNILSTLDFDVVIGSVHAVRYKGHYDAYSTIDFSKFSEKMLGEYLNLYFDELLETLKTVPIDIMAHLTCPLRYINGKYQRNVSSRTYETKITKILEYIIDHKIPMEINTSGANGSIVNLMPDEWIIEKYKQMGGTLVTLGSDAHAKERVGNYFNEAIALLKSLGFNSYCYFENRQIKHCNI